MDLLFLLFVWFMVLIGIPLLCVVFLIVLVYVLISKSAQNKIKEFFTNKEVKTPEHITAPKQKEPYVRKVSQEEGFSKWFYSGVDDETEPVYSYNTYGTKDVKSDNKKQDKKDKREQKRQEKIKANTSVVLKNLVETLQNKSYGAFMVKDSEITNDTDVNITIEPLSLFDDNNELNTQAVEVYFDFMKQEDYFIRIKQTYEKDTLTTGYLIDDLNKDFSKYIDKYVSDNGVYIIQQDFQRFADKKKKDVDVNELSLMFNVEKVDVFDVKQIAELKKLVKEKMDEENN